MSYDPRAVNCIDPTTTVEEMKQMGCTPEQISRKAYLDDVVRRYEAEAEGGR